MNSTLRLGTYCSRDSQLASSPAGPCCSWQVRLVQSRVLLLCVLVAGLWTLSGTQAQTLINVDFGAGATSGKIGFAGTGQSTNDFWNRYRHYEPKFKPGMALVCDGRLDALKFADGSTSKAVLTVTNAPGVWGNATGDPMFDSYLFAPNGSNIVATLSGLEAGHYHFYLYGHADADVTAEQNSVFTLRTGTNQFGPLAPSGAAAWQVSHGWREGAQFTVFRDVPVSPEEPVIIDVAPGPGGIAVLNGLQILSRGTEPPRLVKSAAPAGSGGLTNLLLREVRYEGKLATNEARFSVSIDVESRNTNELSARLFEGDVALLAPKLPPGWRIVKQGRSFTLFAAEPGHHRLELELVAKIDRVEPWNQISFMGPAAAIATVLAKAAAPDTEVQLQSGTPISTEAKSTVQGVLGADQQLALRWQSKAAEVTREALATVDSRITAHLNPATIRYTSQFRYEVLQGRLLQLKVVIPREQTLTRLEGESLRDWQVTTTNEQQVLVVQFIRPVENTATLTLTTEGAITALPSTVVLSPPQPVGVQRETGVLHLTGEDVLAQVESLTALRQINAAESEIAAFHFSLRPASLRVQVTRIEPVLTVFTRVRASLEESRLVFRHELNVNAAKAGIYSLELTPQAGCSVTEVKGEGVDDWKASEGKLRISFNQRMLGDRKLSVQLEQTFTNTPSEFSSGPLPVSGASKQTALIGAVSIPGVQLKTASLEAAREIPITALPERSDELLAFRAEQPGWRVVLAAERLAPRLVAEVFNLLTVGDGLVGGSATVRFAIFNQGVQQFRVQLPAHWQNVEFTGPNLRRKDRQGDVWTVSLQDKAWGGYTLVITYDYAFDPKKASLDCAGAHALDVERESGTVAVTTAAGLAVQPNPVAEPLRPIDPTQLAETDRALITRPVLLAYRYDGNNFALTLNVTRHEQVAVLDAVADRAQLTSVLTESGEMLTQASFMVKNNERQFQRFQLPTNATLWAVAVNGEPVKADRDGDWVLVSLPRGANRDQAYAVDLKYAQQFGRLGRLFPHHANLVAPKTDVPGTYAEWELYVPTSKRVSGFGGNMTVASGTTYGLREGWQEFLRVYRGAWNDYGAAVVVGGGILAFLAALFIWGRRQGFQGVVGVLAVFCLLAILAGMMLPAMSRTKAKAQRIKSVNNLKQIGLAARLYASDHEGKLPKSFEEMKDELSTDKLLFDPETGERYTYTGAGKNESDPHAVLAYSSEKNGRREVVLADGSVQMVTASQFAELVAKDTRAKELSSPAANQPMSAALMQRYGLQPGRSQLAGQGLPQAAPQTPSITPPTRPVAGPGVAANGLAANGTVAGIRSLRIEVPRTGRALQFTRVLNLSGEPPIIRISIMSAKAFVGAQMVFQLTAFLLGLAIVWSQWRRADSRALWLAAGLALALIGTANLFLAWRALGLALIFGIPTLLLILIAWVLWLAVRKRSTGQAAQPVLATPALGSAPPATLGAALLLVVPLAAQCLGAPAALSPAPPVPSASIVRLDFMGKTHERVAQLDATLDFVSASTNVTLNLFGKEVAVQEFTPTAGDPRLVRQGESIAVLLPERGVTSAKLKLLVKVAEESGRYRLDFAIPPALGSRLTLLLDEPQAEVDFPTAVSVQRANQEQQTKVEAVLGAADRISLTWTPRLKRASDVAVAAFAQQAALATFGSGAINTRSIFEYQVMQGELRQVRFALPAGQKLLRVGGDPVRSWDYSETNRHEVIVDLLKGTARSVRLVVETESALEQLPAAASVLLPKPLGVKRATGMVAVRASEELGLTAERVGGLDRVETAEFMRAFGDEKASVVSAWRFLQPDFDLVVRAAVLEPRLEAVARNHFTVDQDQVSLSVHVDYVISRAGVFALRLSVPPETRIENVTCAAMQTWNERTDAGKRVVELALKERTLGALALDMQLTRALTNLPPSLELRGVHPLGVEKLSGFVSVAPEAGVGLKTASVTGLTEIPVTSLPGKGAEFQARSTANPSTGWLAFKCYAGQSQDAPAWRLTLSTELIDSWVRAEIVNFITAGETLVTGRSILRYEIQNAPAKEFRFKAPLAWRNVDVSGAGIRRQDHTNEQWRVELQNRVRGEYRLSVHWELPRPANTNDLLLTGLEAQNVERETGFLSFQARSPLQLAPRQASEDLVRIDARELPAWAQDRSVAGSERPAVLTYRYLRPGWRLLLDVQRFGEAALLQALVENARFRSVVADDGQIMTQMELSVRNNGRQHLEVDLPPGATVWSAFVGGQPVRPAQSGTHLLLPLEGSGADAPISVELTYVGTARFPRTGGKVELLSPRLDVPLKDAHWDLFLPPDFEYNHFGGSMSYERAELVPVAQDFTLAEYKRQEDAKQASIENEAVDFLRQARTDINGTAHNINRLNYFNQRSLANDVAARELKQLEEDVSRNQGSNLIRGQQNFNTANFDRLGVAPVFPTAPAQQQASNAEYETRVAEQQAKQLQKAQAVAVTRVSPLHVNLPTRGLRHSFVQVLQTEINKPLTISLSASNDRQAGWLKAIAFWAAGFVALWIIAALTLSYRPQPRP